jgi:hypothetical protein
MLPTIQLRLLSSRLLSKNLHIKIYTTIILPVVLYESLTLREEHRLRVFEKRMLRTVRGWKLQEAGRRLHNKELHKFYASSIIIRIIINSKRM